MKRIFILVCSFSLCACSSSSIYDDLAKELVVSPTQYVDYSLSWHNINILSNTDSPNFSDVLKNCTNKLEVERKGFMNKNNPTKVIATIQLYKCLNDKGWLADAQESIILQ